MAYIRFMAKTKNMKTERPYIVAFVDEKQKNKPLPVYDAKCRCYAETGPLSWHWEKVKTGERGECFEVHCHQIDALPAGSMLRLSQAGDLPTNDENAVYHLSKTSGNSKTGKISVTTTPQCPAACPMMRKGTGSKRFSLKKARALLKAATSFGKKAWTYTHYRQWADVLRLNLETSATVNVSCNSIPEAIRAHKLGLPVTVVTTQTEPMVKIDGIAFLRCPAQYKNGVTCATCGNGSPLCLRK